MDLSSLAQFLPIVAGAGLDSFTKSIEKLMALGQGPQMPMPPREPQPTPSDTPHRAGLRLEAGGAPGMTIAPQLLEHLARIQGQAATQPPPMPSPTVADPQTIQMLMAMRQAAGAGGLQ